MFRTEQCAVKHTTDPLIVQHFKFRDKNVFRNAGLKLLKYVLLLREVI
jgi:hypothetical protein